MAGTNYLGTILGRVQKWMNTSCCHTTRCWQGYKKSANMVLGRVRRQVYLMLCPGCTCYSTSSVTDRTHGCCCTAQDFSISVSLGRAALSPTDKLWPIRSADHKYKRKTSAAGTQDDYKTVFLRLLAAGGIMVCCSEIVESQVGGY